MKNIAKYLTNCPTYSQWQKIGIHHHHGICIPIFSLKTKTSSGIGEFLDLLPLIDFCKIIGMDVIQLLPINECGIDPSPYDAISSCALHPIYLKLQSLPYLKDNAKLTRKLKIFDKYKKRKRVAYEEIRQLKMNFLFEYYLQYYENFLKDKHFLIFVKNNPWLYEYSLFRFLQDNLKKKKWFEWEDKYKNPKKETLSALFESNKKNCYFYYILQYLCFSQMNIVKDYASINSVFIKGDIPILINPNSVDVWYDRKIFDLSHVAGCPPDDTDPLGQKWGFPLFNWQAMEKKDFFWWKRRLNIASSCFHIYRIDHVVGFFRIWAIKPKDSALHGIFLPKHPAKWKEQGYKILMMMIKSSSMLPLAEDLGLIPKMTYVALKKLGLCGLKVMRWQKKKGQFIDIDKYPPLSLTCVSNHDFPSLQLWWENFPKDAKKYAKYKKWKYKKTFSNKFRESLLYDSHHSSSLFHINPLSEYLSFFEPLVWKNPIDERINISGVENDVNWKYRMRPYLEDLLKNKKLITIIKKLIS
jgi:4-alpha-glucanotransferase